MASRANIGVFDAQNKLTYDRTPSDLKNLKEHNFSFIIVQIDGGNSQACFRITGDDSKVLRENLSKLFPTGAIEKKSTKLKKDVFVVKLKKQAGVNLDDYF
ncbi:hypothetical protein BsWGS_06050 [Bradybaena similaris]